MPSRDFLQNCIMIVDKGVNVSKCSRYIYDTSRENKLRYTAAITCSYAIYNRVNRFELPAVICMIHEALVCISDNKETPS